MSRIVTIQDSIDSSQIRIRDGTHRSKDEQGYLIIKDNPVAIAGVFPFLRSQIDVNFNSQTTDDVVYVLRSEDSLKQAVDMFRNKPIVHHHKWVGRDGERVDADGTIGTHVYYKDGALYGDLIIYNPDLIESIENGSCKQLSPGYNAVVQEDKGTYNGKSYTHAIIYTGVNHLGVVEQGRAGSRLSIQDKQDIFMDKKQNASTTNRYIKRNSANVADSTKMAKIVDEQESEKTKTQKTFTKDSSNSQLNTKYKRIRDNDTIISYSKQKLNNGKISQEDYKFIMDSKNKENRQLRDEIEAIKKTQKQIMDESNRLRIYQDRIDEIRRYLPEFKTYGERRVDILSKRAYEFYTGNKLADGLDSRTAFLEAVKMPRFNKTLQANKTQQLRDSDNLVAHNMTTLNKLCDMWSR